MKTLKRCRNFSIVEVIVVCAVVAILASLIMSASSSVREAGKRTTCINNLKQIQVVYEAYRKDHRKAPAGDLVNHDDFSFAKDYVSISDLDTFICPGDKNADQMTSLDHLDGHTSYSYIPEQSTAYAGRANYELAGNDEVLSTLTLVAFDKNGENHNGDRNIVYLHGSGNSNSGIAKTLKAGSYEWASEELADNGSDSVDENASEENTNEENANEENANEENANEENANEENANEENTNEENANEENANEENANEEAPVEEKSELEEAQEELEVREEEALEASEEATAAEEAKEEAAEAAEEANDDKEAADKADEVAEKEAAEATEELKDAEQELEQAKEALENGPQGYDSENITLPEDNKGNKVVVNTDVRVTFEILGSGFSSNSIYSDVSVGSDTYEWQDGDGEDHTKHVVGVEGLTLDLDVETGLTIAINGRSSYYDSSNLQGKSNLKVYRDGDKATSVGGYNGQDSVKTFLSDYIDGNGNVTIGADQVIFLMELGTTNTNKSYYDMQDLVVLATFEVVATEEDVADLEAQLQEAKEALIIATTNADVAEEKAEAATAAAEEAAAAAEAAEEAAEKAAAALEQAEDAVLAAEEVEKACQKPKNENNGFGNGDQDAPGNSLENNNAENAQEAVEPNAEAIAALEAKIAELTADYNDAVKKGKSKKAKNKLKKINEKQAELAELQ